jgi:hypothetical protein
MEKFVSKIHLDRAVEFYYRVEEWDSLILSVKCQNKPGSARR